MIAKFSLLANEGESIYGHIRLVNADYRCPALRKLEMSGFLNQPDNLSFNRQQTATGDPLGHNPTVNFQQFSDNYRLVH